MSYNEFFQNMRRNSSGMVPLFAEFGELVAYDPQQHTAQFKLPMRLDADPKSPTYGQPIPTGWVQLGTPFNGPGYGAQFPPPAGAQALIIYLDQNHELPVAACFMFNDIELAPFPDGKTHGWKDAKGNAFTTTQDGPQDGDGVGAARVHGVKYVQHTTVGGHVVSLDDVNQVIEHYSAGGHVFKMDDANKVISHITIGGHQHIMDDVNKVIKHVSAGGLQHIMDDAAKEIAHVASNVGLGDRVANLDATKAAITQGHINDLANNINSLRRDDLVKFAAAMVAAAVPNAGAVIANLAALVGITVPAGSSVVKIK